MIKKYQRHKKCTQCSERKSIENFSYGFSTYRKKDICKCCENPPDHYYCGTSRVNRNEGARIELNEGKGVVPKLIEEMEKYIIPKRFVNDDVLKNNSGVYFLFNKEELVYIGSSVSPRDRIRYHIRKNKNNFDSYSFLNVPAAKRLKVEKVYIRNYLPNGNRIHNDLLNIALGVNQRHYYEKDIAMSIANDYK